MLVVRVRSADGVAILDQVDGGGTMLRLAHGAPISDRVDHDYSNAELRREPVWQSSPAPLSPARGRPLASASSLATDPRRARLNDGDEADEH
jgi:hypothetical protein